MQSSEVSKELFELAASSPESVTDEELILLLSASTEQRAQDMFFAEFYRRFHSRVVSWCFRMIRNRARAFDLAQDVFLKAWRHMGSFRGDSRASTWLYVITRNHCLSAVERLASDPLESGAPVPTRLADSAFPHPDGRIEREQECRRLWQVMSSALEPLEARIMALHYAYEVPLGTLTDQLALANPSGAKAYIVNGRRKIKGALERDRVTKRNTLARRQPPQVPCPEKAA